jgi:protein pelota
MRLLKKDILKDGAGYIRLIPEHVEDLWHIYNIISEYDAVSCSTVRKIEKSTSTGKITEKRRIFLTISVKNIDFDLQSASMRISGKNIQENDWVKIGQFHTSEIELNRELTITKKNWDAIHIQRIQDSTGKEKKFLIFQKIFQSHQMLLQL